MNNIYDSVEWKPVSLNEACFNEGCSDLVGIEECTDYSLDFNQIQKRKNGDNEQRPNKKRKKKHPKKVNKEKIETFELSQNGSTLELGFDVAEENENEKISVDAWREFDLPDVLMKGIIEQGFQYPTQIQSMTLPSAIYGRKDILGAAPTGSGKTLAFGLPILNAIYKMKNDNTNDDHPLYALILTPTRELAIQIKNHLENVAKYSDIKVINLVGGMSSEKQIRLLNKYPEIVIATPGRLWELIQLGYEHLTKVDRIKFLVLDETDRMLEKGHFQDLEFLLEKINMDEEAKKLRQNFVFSATLTLVHSLPKYVMKKIKRGKKNVQMTSNQKLGKIIKTIGIKNPKIVDITEGIGLSETLTESKINCSITDKDYYVYYFLQKHQGKTIIFCNSIGCVKRLATLLTLLDCKVYPLHASMQQRQRLKNLDNFKDRDNSILVATDVAARGLDIPKVDHVLHYQVPRTSECYIHRSGRTARANKEGLTLLIIDPSELQNYIKVCKTLNKNEDIPSFPIEKSYLDAVKERVNLARELDKLQLLVRKTNSEAGWFEKAAKDMDMIVDHMSMKYDTKEGARSKKLGDLKRKQLTTLLEKPIFPKTNYTLLNNNPENYNEIINTEKSAIDVMKDSLNVHKQKKNLFVNKKKLSLVQ